MSIHLILSSNSIRNTVISCDSLGIHYDISRPESSSVISIKRWDPSTNSDTTVGEIQYHLISKSQIKLGVEKVEAGIWYNINDVLSRKGHILSSDRTFEIEDRRKYKWNSSTWGKLELRRYEDDDKSEPLVSYHRKRAARDSYLEIHDHSVIRDLDYIIVTFLIMEKRRRDEQKAYYY